MTRNTHRLAVVAALALSLAAIGCSRDKPEAEKVAERPKPPAKVLQPTATPPVVAAVDPFGRPDFVPTGPAEVLAKEALPPASGPVGTDFEAWKAGEAAFKYYAGVNGFSEETTKSFFLKHIANNGDHYRLMMFGVLPGGPRYIAVKVYKDGRAEVLPDEM